MHDSFDWMATTIPESIYWSLVLDGCVHTSNLVYICTLLWMVVPMPHLHVSEISVVFVLAGLPLPLSRTSCFRGHLLHNILSPSLQSPSWTLKDHFSDLCVLSYLAKSVTASLGHVKNISFVDYSWSRLSKTYDFGSALVGSYGLASIEKLALSLAPIGALPQWTAHAELFFLNRNKVSIPNHFVSGVIMVFSIE